MCESNHSAKEDDMRQARLKPDYQDTWHHCYNRTVGTRSNRPFGDAEKEVFVRILKRLAAFYTVRILSYTFMSNHFHRAFLLLRRVGANRPAPLCRRHCPFSGAHPATSV